VRANVSVVVRLLPGPVVPIHARDVSKCSTWGAAPRELSAPPELPADDEEDDEPPPDDEDEDEDEDDDDDDDDDEDARPAAAVVAPVALAASAVVVDFVPVTAAAGFGGEGSDEPGGFGAGSFGAAGFGAGGDTGAGACVGGFGGFGAGSLGFGTVTGGGGSGGIRFAAASPATMPKRAITTRPATCRIPQQLPRPPIGCGLRRLRNNH
jgi:hypothetical protein